MDFIISSPHGHSLLKLPDSIPGNIAPIEKPEKTEAIKNMISSSSEEDSKGSKLNGVSFEKSPHKENSSLKDLSESELKEADLDLLDCSVSQVDSSNSLKVPCEFSEVNLENSSKRENSSFKHSSGSLENSEPLQLDSLNSFLSRFSIQLNFQRGMNFPPMRMRSELFFLVTR